MSSVRTLSHDEARAFYDRLGARQDTQAFYEDAATGRLRLHGAFEQARAVLEFGCGTGRFAERLLAEHLPADARYRGLDLSATMVALATERLARFGARAQVAQSDGTPRVDAPDASFDRVLSNYVLDLLSNADIQAFVDEARRLLVPGGLLCLASLTHGRGPLSRVVSRFWEGVARLRPSLVGGCRPVELRGFLPAAQWEIRHAEVVAPFGLASEVVVAARRPDAECAGVA